MTNSFGGPLQFKLSKFHCSWFNDGRQQQQENSPRDSRPCTFSYNFFVDRHVNWFDFYMIIQRELRGYNVLKTSHERVQNRQLDCEQELKQTKETLDKVKAIYDAQIYELQLRCNELETQNTEVSLSSSFGLDVVIHQLNWMLKKPTKSAASSIWRRLLIETDFYSMFSTCFAIYSQFWNFNDPVS